MECGQGIFNILTTGKEPPVDPMPFPAMVGNIKDFLQLFGPTQNLFRGESDTLLGLF